jgi:very-short-patch-repair endonuclease
MLVQTSKYILANELQRKLRHSMMDAERILWQALRGKQMSGFKFRRQHPFEDFILDFVCLDARLVIEVDGGHHADQPDKDAICADRLVGAGFRVLRFWNHEVIQQLEAVKEKIWSVLLAKPECPSPP